MMIFNFYTFANPKTIVNKSGFYWNPQSDAPQDCSEQIKLNKSYTAESYCGFVACTGEKFSDTDGCLEPASGIESDSQSDSLTSGGYYTWFSISPGNGSQPTCATPQGSSVKCNIIQNGNEFSLNFSYLSVPQNITIDGINPDATDSIAYRGVNVSGLEYSGTFADALFQRPDLADVKYFAAQHMNTIRLPIRAEFLFRASKCDDEAAEKPCAAAPYPLPNPTKEKPFIANEIYLAAVYDTVSKYLENGFNVILDLHNYMHYCQTGPDIGQNNDLANENNTKCTLLSSDNLQDIWYFLLNTQVTLDSSSGSKNNVSLKQLAKRYSPPPPSPLPSKQLSSNPSNYLIFGLMNEPYSSKLNPLCTYFKPMSKNQSDTITDVFTAQFNVAHTIKEVLELDNLMLMSGNSWDGLHSWETPTGDYAPTTPSSCLDSNADALLKAYTDLSPSKNFNLAIEVHQYFDSDFSGRYLQCTHDSLESINFHQIVSWAQTNGVKLFLGEFGGSTQLPCQGILFKVLQAMEGIKDSPFIGWTAWTSNRNLAQTCFMCLQTKPDQYTPNPPLHPHIETGGGNLLMDKVFSKYLPEPTLKKTLKFSKNL